MTNVDRKKWKHYHWNLMFCGNEVRGLRDGELGRGRDLEPTFNEYSRISKMPKVNKADRIG